MLFRCRDPKKGFSAGENIRVADACVVDIMLNACGDASRTKTDAAPISRG